MDERRVLVGPKEKSRDQIIKRDAILNPERSSEFVEPRSRRVDTYDTIRQKESKGL